jgi:hypothetical protein
MTETAACQKKEFTRITRDLKDVIVSSWISANPSSPLKPASRLGLLTFGFAANKE